MYRRQGCSDKRYTRLQEHRAQRWGDAACSQRQGSSTPPTTAPWKNDDRWYGGLRPWSLTPWTTPNEERRSEREREPLTLRPRSPDHSPPEDRYRGDRLILTPHAKWGPYAKQTRATRLDYFDDHGDRDDRRGSGRSRPGDRRDNSDHYYNARDGRYGRDRHSSHHRRDSDRDYSRRQSDRDRRNGGRSGWQYGR